MVHDPAGFDKEARFFCQPGPFDLAAYHALFARPAGRIAGEWTPDYLWQPSSIDGVAAAAPHAKILFLVRDPVDRFVSGLAHLLMYDSRSTGERFERRIAPVCTASRRDACCAGFRAHRCASFSTNDA